MDIVKLIFEHDLLLEKISGNSDPRNEEKQSYSLEDFMKPIPTYSRFYLTGTDLDNQRFGINCLKKIDNIITTLSNVFEECMFTTNRGKTFSRLSDALNEINIGDSIICHTQSLKNVDSIEGLSINDKNGIRHIIPQLTNLLDEDGPVFFKEKALDGYDIHIFSKTNIYESLFNALKPLIDNNQRFFSINGKKVNSERMFYFETYRLERPPHGFQEVFPETVI
jgi:hypothetical protein